MQPSLQSQHFKTTERNLVSFSNYHSIINPHSQPKTIITKEYPATWKQGDEPYYAVNDERNSALYGKYKELSDKQDKVIFGGRLGMYKYFDMDDTIAAAWDLWKKI